jgi:hypothetical protein
VTLFDIADIICHSTEAGRRTKKELGGPAGGQRIPFLR